MYIAFRNVMHVESSSREGWGYIRGQTAVCILYILIWNDCFEMIMIIWAHFALITELYDVMILSCVWSNQSIAIFLWWYAIICKCSIAEFGSVLYKFMLVVFLLLDFSFNYMSWSFMIYILFDFHTLWLHTSSV